MKYELVVVADTNDADYDTRIETVTQAQIDYLIPIIEKIKAVPRKDRVGTYQWPTQYRLRQYKSPQDTYGLTDEEVEILNEDFFPFGDENYGIHTLISIEYYPIPEKVRLL